MNLSSLFAPKQVEELPEFYARLSEALADADLNESLDALFADDSSLAEQFHRSCYCSEFVQQYLIANPAHLVEFLRCARNARFDYRALFESRLIVDAGVAGFDRSLRQLRNFVQSRLIWHTVNQSLPLFDITEELSKFASLAIEHACRFHRAQLESRFGTPRCARGERQAFLVLGMGKLGAGELNLSSDIDLIFAFPNAGSTDGERQLDNQEFFSQLAKAMIASLNVRNADGFVFRVDMRLRPWGDAGALVSNFNALEDYYQNHGREWERYAMVKARVVANDGDSATADKLNEILRNFTFRKYIDFSVIDALRKLKAMIRDEVKRKKTERDIKLGSGGIREIEFIAQVFQLIRGGRDKSLQNNRIRDILPLLETLRCLPPEHGAKLLQSYEFLRNTEHVIQAWRDEQSHRLPEDERARLALCRALGFDDWSSFAEHLNRHRHFVQSEFELLIEARDDAAEDDSGPYQTLWQRACNPLAEPDTNGSEVEQALFGFARHGAIRSLNEINRQRLDLFMDVLLKKIEGQSDPEVLLNRMLALVLAVVRRSAYLLLLIENPDALERLLMLVKASAWIAETLTAHPALLDELLDPEALFYLPPRAELLAELEKMIDERGDDLEQILEVLRYFRSAHALRVAASEVTGALPLMKVSDYLTFVAEAVIDGTLRVAWREMIASHGYPDGVRRESPEFLIVGYGKLGGIEMNHGSDLDLVFLHSADPNGSTDGSRSIDNLSFYARLGQKIIHILSANTPSGRAYEVDMRLRPSGNSGLLTTTIAGFERYQNTEAWTWEHQALVRARPIAGDEGLAQQFEAIRAAILARQRDLTQLRRDIVSMRNKMRENLGTPAAKADQCFHIKQDPGGIVDIEFMVQYAVLAWSHQEPSLTRYTDNIRILEGLAHTRLLPSTFVEQLSAAYKTLRSESHRLTLEQLPSTVAGDSFAELRAGVCSIWQQLLVDGQPEY